MAGAPDVAQLEDALAAAGHAHHDYEQHFLKGQRDVAWPGWYAAYVLGRLGDFASPTDVTGLLQSAPEDPEWAAAAARHILAGLP